MNRNEIKLDQFSYYQPTQPRAERTFSLILKTALETIENDGIDALNTNRVAEDCQINISTLYHYFRNKDVIVYALYKRWFDKVEAIAEDHRKNIKPGTNYKKFYRNMILDFLTVEDYTPKAAVALEQAIKIRSELAEYDNLVTEASVEGYIEDLITFGANKSTKELVIPATQILIAVWGAITIAASYAPEEHINITECTADMIAAVIKRTL
ncbi:MAG: AcrR family transcriptional regulator [Chitinophagales bacterium]|jgi:AcrR family transcriptional regulator